MIRELPPGRVSRNQKVKPENWTSPGLARVSYHGNGAVCSCGAAMHHDREKVLEDKIDRHLKKRHNGRGIRL